MSTQPSWVALGTHANWINLIKSSQRPNPPAGTLLCTLKILAQAYHQPHFNVCRSASSTTRDLRIGTTQPSVEKVHAHWIWACQPDTTSIALVSAGTAEIPQACIADMELSENQSQSYGERTQIGYGCIKRSLQSKRICKGSA
eukprot:357392-Chlamydomonas_euryale.AAC.39